MKDICFYCCPETTTGVKPWLIRLTFFAYFCCQKTLNATYFYFCVKILSCLRISTEQVFYECKYSRFSKGTIIISFHPSFPFTIQLSSLPSSAFHLSSFPLSPYLLSHPSTCYMWFECETPHIQCVWKLGLWWCSFEKLCKLWVWGLEQRKRTIAVEFRASRSVLHLPKLSVFRLPP